MSSFSARLGVGGGVVSSMHVTAHGGWVSSFSARLGVGGGVVSSMHVTAHGGWASSFSAHCHELAVCPSMKLLVQGSFHILKEPSTAQLGVLGNCGAARIYQR